MQLDRYTKAGALALALASLTMADGPKFTGYVTSTWNKDLNSPASGNNSPYNYFGNKDGSFLLNAAHLTIAGGDANGASYTIDLDAGKDAVTDPEAITGGGMAFSLHQAFIAVPFGKSPVGLQAGKFYTSEGIEVLNSGNNPTVSRGLLFGQSEPVSHTGAILTVKINDQLSVAAGGVNGWDVWTTSAADGMPMAYGKVALSFGNALSGTLSAYYGPNFSSTSGRNCATSVDFTGVTKVVPNLDLNFQANYLQKEHNGSTDEDGTQKDLTLIGFGVQPLLHLGDAQVGLRYEFLNADPGVGKSTTLQTVAVAPGYKLTPSTLLRVEYRIDFASDKVFEDDGSVLAEDGAYTKTADVDQVVSAELNFTF